MLHNPKVFFILLLILAETTTGFAQRRPLLFSKPFVEDYQAEFKHFGTDEGLSYDRTTDLLQDKRGYIWIATLNGLNKFDGNSFSIYKLSPSGDKSHEKSVFTSLTQTDDGIVYTGTEKGLYRYDRTKNQLIKVLLKFDTLDYTNSNIRDILFHHDTMWIIIRKGKLLMLNMKTGIIDTTFKMPNKTSQPYYYYHSLYMDKGHTLWFSDRNIYPLSLNPQRNKITQYIPSRTDFSKKREGDASGYLEDSKHRFWVSGSDGVYLLDRKTQIYNKFIRATTWCMAEDTSGNIWIGTGMGLLKYNFSKKEIIAYSNKKDNPSSLSSNNVYQILFDKAGNIWLATSKGVNVLSSPKYPFHKFIHLAGIDNSPAGNSVSAVTEGKNGSLWIGYDNEGMDYFDRKTNTFHHFKHDRNNKNSLAGNKVADLYMDSRGRLWTGLWQGIGFNIYDPLTNKFTLITYDKKSFRKDWYNDFIETSDGKMYIGFWGAKGLAGFNPNTYQFETFFGTNIFPRFCCRLITRLEKDNRNNIWFGTTDCGVFRINPETGAKNAYYESDSSGLRSDEIKDLLFSKGEMWVLNSYLQKYDTLNDNFITYGEDIFSSYSLKAMLRDEKGNFWISTENKGLLVFNPDTDSLLANYFRHDGLQSNKFNDARAMLSTGEMFFGGQQGFNLFYPSKITCSKKLPRIFFGKFNVSGKIRYYETSNIKTINLTPDENTFTIELLNSNMVNLEQFKYEVKLTDYDKNWVEVSPKTREIRYTAVPFGKYELLYKITDSKGRLSTQPASLEIIIATPFFKTWWFYTLILLLLVSIITAFFKINYDKLKAKQRNLDLRERLFRLQVNPHFLFNSLVAIQNYILNHKAKDAGLYLSNYARFFRIMLESSQTETILLETEIEMLMLYLGLQQIRYPGKFDFEFEVDEQLPEDLTFIPAMITQPILENAIEHGFKNKNEQGMLTIRFKKIDDFIRFEVKDNGIGITASKKIKSPGKNRKHKSSAINIIRERVEVFSRKYHFPMLFKITEIINNDKVEGTLVTINLPLARNH